jgi:very-short-patch-repair endonuclease
LGSQLYCREDLTVDPRLVLAAWRDSLPADAVFAGASAAWILGLDYDPTNPVDIVVPTTSGLRSRSGLGVRRCSIPSGDTTSVRGLPVMTLPRMLLDVCHRWTAVEALVAIDMAINLRVTNEAALTRYAEMARGKHGASRLRSLIKMAAAAESPMETRLRWLLIRAGLPCPEVQTDLRDANKQFLGRADLYYPHERLVIEFDGGNHRERLVEDNRRQNGLINAGFRVLRFTTADIYGRPDVVVMQVQGALSGASVRTFASKSAHHLPRKGDFGDKNADGRSGVKPARKEARLRRHSKWSCHEPHSVF